MRRGDIVFIKYKYSIISWVIRKFLKCEYNHCGIAMCEKYILHIKAGTLFVENIKKYKNKKYKIKGYRLEKVSSKEIDKIIQYILNKKYKELPLSYILWLLSLLQMLVFKKPKLVGVTCSGLIGLAFSQVGLYFKKEFNPDLLTPADIYNFNIIRLVRGEKHYKYD